MGTDSFLISTISLYWLGLSSDRGSASFSGKYFVQASFNMLCKAWYAFHIVPLFVLRLNDSQAFKGLL